jgi:hypothetical protein
MNDRVVWFRAVTSSNPIADDQPFGASRHGYRFTVLYITSQQ